MKRKKEDTAKRFIISYVVHSNCINKMKWNRKFLAEMLLDKCNLLFLRILRNIYQNTIKDFNSLLSGLYFAKEGLTFLLFRKWKKKYYCIRQGKYYNSAILSFLILHIIIKDLIYNNKYVLAIWIIFFPYELHNYF